MKKILLAIVLAMFCVGCDDVNSHYVQYTKTGEIAGGSYVVKKITIPLELTLTNTVYEITQTNAMVIFSFGIKNEEETK